MPDRCSTDYTIHVEGLPEGYEFVRTQLKAQLLSYSFRGDHFIVLALLLAVTASAVRGGCVK